jgi:hypothetical protein
MCAPFGTYTNAMRRGASASRANARARGANIASRNGNAIAVPMPRNTVRRVIIDRLSCP